MEPMTGLEIRDAEAGDYEAYVRLFAELGLDDAPVSASKFAQEWRQTPAFAERAVGSSGSPSGARSRTRPAPLADRVGAGGPAPGGRALLRRSPARARRCDRRHPGTSIRGTSPPGPLRIGRIRVLAREPRASRLTWDRVPAQGSGAKAIEPADDEHLERRFELARGTFAEHRRQPDRVLRQLDAGDGRRSGHLRRRVSSAAARSGRRTRRMRWRCSMRSGRTPDRSTRSSTSRSSIRSSLADALVAAGATLRFDFREDARRALIRARSALLHVLVEELRAGLPALAGLLLECLLRSCCRCRRSSTPS